jgi:hypothetical protein
LSRREPIAIFTIWPRDGDALQHHRTQCDNEESPQGCTSHHYPPVNERASLEIVVNPLRKRKQS